MAKHVIGNILVDDGDLTYFQWLNIYKHLTKKEYRNLLDYHKEAYEKEYKKFIEEEKCNEYDY